MYVSTVFTHKKEVYALFIFYLSLMKNLGNSEIRCNTYFSQNSLDCKRQNATKAEKKFRKQRIVV